MKKENKDWKQQFKEEFGIHFKGSKGELNFAIAFIEDLLKEKNKEDFDKRNKELFEEQKCDHHWIFYPYYNSSLAQSGCWICDKCGKITFPIKNMEKTNINYSDLSTEEKLVSISLFPEEAKKDENQCVRLAAYRILGFTEEAKKDEDEYIRLAAYRKLGFTEEAKKDKDWFIRLEAYKTLGFTEEAKRDKDWFIVSEAYRILGFTTEEVKKDKENIRLEAEKYFTIKDKIKKYEKRK